MGTTLSQVMKINNSSMGPICNGQTYNVIVTTHALIVIILLAMPVLIGGYGN